MNVNVSTAALNRYRFRPARDCCPPSTGRTARRDQPDDAISKGLAFRGVYPIP